MVKIKTNDNWPFFPSDDHLKKMLTCGRGGSQGRGVAEIEPMKGFCGVRL